MRSAVIDVGRPTAERQSPGAQRVRLVRGLLDGLDRLGPLGGLKGVQIQLPGEEYRLRPESHRETILLEDPRNRLAGLRILDRGDLDRGEELIFGDAADGFNDRAVPREGLWIGHEMDDAYPHVSLEALSHRRPAFLGLNGSDDSIPA